MIYLKKVFEPTLSNYCLFCLADKDNIKL